MILKPDRLEAFELDGHLRDVAPWLLREMRELAAAGERMQREASYLVSRASRRTAKL